MSDDDDLPLAGRLSIVHKRKLKKALPELLASERLTIETFSKLAERTLRIRLAPGVAEKVLGEFGYIEGAESFPVMSDDGMHIGNQSIWEQLPVGHPLTAQAKAERLAARLDELCDAFVGELLDDPEIGYASLHDKAVEGTRTFADHLARAVVARGRFGAPTTLPACRDAATLVFNSLTPRF